MVLYGPEPNEGASFPHMKQEKKKANSSKNIHKPNSCFGIIFRSEEHHLYFKIFSYIKIKKRGGNHTEQQKNC
jgi:hypothetical protein